MNIIILNLCFKPKSLNYFLLFTFLSRFSTVTYKENRKKKKCCLVWCMRSDAVTLSKSKNWVISFLTLKIQFFKFCLDNAWHTTDMAEFIFFLFQCQAYFTWDKNKKYEINRISNSVNQPPFSFPSSLIERVIYFDSKL